MCSRKDVHSSGLAGSDEAAMDVTMARMIAAKRKRPCSVCTWRKPYKSEVKGAEDLYAWSII